MVGEREPSEDKDADIHEDDSTVTDTQDSRDSADENTNEKSPESTEENADPTENDESDETPETVDESRSNTLDETASDADNDTSDPTDNTEHDTIESTETDGDDSEGTDTSEDASDKESEVITDEMIKSTGLSLETMGYSLQDGPVEDREMPLAEHITEMIRRLAIVIAIAGLVSLLTFPFADSLINFLWNSVLPAGETTRPRLYGILELKLTELKVASLAGLIIALPVLVYETYQFMRPGLYPNERRYYLAAIPTSLVLAIVGVAFAFFVILPAIFTYFLYYSDDVATIGFALGRTFDLILLLMGYMALVFQIPLFIMLAIMMGLTSRQWLADRRLIFWGAFLGISFIFSPDPTGMAPIIVTLTMISLFEGTLFLAKWAGRTRRAASS